MKRKAIMPLSLLLSALIIFSTFTAIPISATTVKEDISASNKDDIYVITGSSDWLDGWSPAVDGYFMTKGEDGIYSIVVEDVPAGEANYSLKVVKLISGDEYQKEWIGINGSYYNYDFMIKKDCDVTVTYNPETKEINVTGEGVANPEYPIYKITAVGSGQNGFLNDILWEPDAEENKMEEINPGIYAITYPEVAANTEYQVKFAANGIWNMNWGYESDSEIVFGTPTAAQFQADHSIIFTPISEYEYVTITLLFDLTRWDTVTKDGAEFNIIVCDESDMKCSKCGELMSNDVVPATCTQDGSIGLSCKKCYNRVVIQEIKAHHIKVVDKETPATCAKSGLTKGSHCSVCGEIIQAQQTIPAKGHIEVIDEAKPATCTESGLTEGSHCSVCGDVFKAQRTIPANGHRISKDNAVPATCIETGLTEGSHCSVCGEVLTAQKVIPAKGHSEIIDKGVPATCTSNGKTDGSHCQVCGEIIKAQKEIPSLGHKPIIVPATPATCEHDGHTVGSVCENCGMVYLASQIIPRLPHTEVKDAAVKADCTHTGLTDGSHCSVCGEIIVPQEVIPSLGHNYQFVQGTPATETETGLTDGIQCERCGDWLIPQKLIPRIGEEVLIGDPNNDGNVDITDATIVQQFAAEVFVPTALQRLAADTNGDGNVDITDATLIQMLAAEIINKF